MLKETDLCMGCMNKKDPDENGVCKNCGYSENAAYITTYLAPKTFLAGRYIVGKLVSYNGESALYFGFDMVDNRKVTVREYMPETLCIREKDAEKITVKPSCMPLYKTYLSEFFELHSTLKTSDGIPNIQTVLDVFYENNTAYAVMDYITGISLKTYLSNCGEVISWEQIKELFPPALTTLGILHGKGIIHRAISTSTIFVTEKMELKIIGFGISASRTTDSDITSEIFDGYAPPEQYLSARRNGTWTDVFGICAVLYRCLTGQNPPSSVARLKNDTLVEPMMINRAVPMNVSKVIMKGLNLDVEGRISTISELVDRLFELSQPVEDTMSEIHVPVRRPASEHRPNSTVPRSSSAKPSYAAKSKKKKKNDATKKAIIGMSITGAVILIFIIAMIVTSMNGNGNKPSADETTAAQSEISEVTQRTLPDEALETDAPSETTAPVSASDSYVLPNFTGRDYEAIITNTRYAYLTIVPTYEFNNVYGKGEIFYQNIEPTTPVTAGTTLNVKVSKGTGVVQLPDYTNKSVEQYKAELGALGVKYDSKTEENGDVKEGYVIRCSVDVGADVNVADGQTVTIYVALTPTVTTTEATLPPETTDEETVPEV